MIMASSLDDSHEGSCRFSDVTPGSEKRLPPIGGFEKKPIVSLEDAVKPIEPFVEEVQHMIWTVKGNCTEPKDGLSVNESAAIMLYTLEWAPSENSFYHIFNTVLRSEDRRKLTPWFLYLRLFIHALSKLPSSTPRVLYRGVTEDLSAGYFKGKEFVWWPFSSCTVSLETLEQHIGRTGKRTIFNILCRFAIDISRHSCYQSEQEFLFYPARQFKVTTVGNPASDLHIIELEETEPPFPLFKMPTAQEPEPQPTPKDDSINILLVGERGVGKSTFINAFVNYLTFGTVGQAQSRQPIVLKPLSFRIMTNDTFEEKKITFGDIDQLVTQRCYKYIFDLPRNNGKKLCIIDTPSLEDGYEFGQHILDYVNTLGHLNAVCFLLLPDASRLSTSFQSCFAQLMNRLGRNFRENIIFCFTNALMTLSDPGTTAALLRKMFTSLQMNDIPFSRNNTFFFENESFRYLLAVKNGIDFTDDDEAGYTASWPESVIESNRLLIYIQNRRPYPI